MCLRQVHFRVFSAQVTVHRVTLLSIPAGTSHCGIGFPKAVYINPQGSLRLSKEYINGVVGGRGEIHGYQIERGSVTFWGSKVTHEGKDMACVMYQFFHATCCISDLSCTNNNSRTRVVFTFWWEAWKTQAKYRTHTSCLVTWSAHFFINYVSFKWGQPVSFCTTFILRGRLIHLRRRGHQPLPQSSSVKKKVSFQRTVEGSDNSWSRN